MSAPPSPRELAAVDAVWNDMGIDDEERARRLSRLNGMSEAVNRADIADVRQWEQSADADDVGRARAWMTRHRTEQAV